MKTAQLKDILTTQAPENGLYEKNFQQEVKASIPFTRHDNVIAPIFFKTRTFQNIGEERHTPFAHQDAYHAPFQEDLYVRRQQKSPRYHPDLEFNQHSYERRRVKVRKKPKTAFSWLYEEVDFSMNKLSLAGMIASLMGFGALFFCAGFIVAASTLPNYSFGQNSSQDTGVKAPKWVTKIAGKAVSQTTAKYQSNIMNRVTNPIVNKVPVPLQPFASKAQSQMQGRAQQQVQTQLHQTQRHLTYGPSQAGTVTYYAPQNQVVAAPSQEQPQEYLVAPSTGNAQSYQRTPY
ncbi:MAG TPA: hypothetical protein VI959_05350 [Alphaproteobacteria bacterium]|nr:hypothetical protein [Alphaproteobacteria bacterium]